MASVTPPNQTLYITNLNDKIRKPDLRLSLYTLFCTYGVVLDVVALKTMKGRGQAHVAFRDIGAATQAMRALDGMDVFGKKMVRVAEQGGHVGWECEMLTGKAHRVRQGQVQQDCEARRHLQDGAPRRGRCRGRRREAVRAAAGRGAR